MQNLTGLFVAPALTVGILMGAIGLPALAVDAQTPYQVQNVVEYDTGSGGEGNVQYTSFQDGYMVKSGDNYYYTSQGEIFHVPADDPALEGLELSETVKR